MKMMDCFNNIFYDSRYTIYNIKQFAKNYEGDGNPYNPIINETKINTGDLNEEELNFVNYMNSQKGRYATVNCLKKYYNVPMDRKTVGFFEYIRSNFSVPWNYQQSLSDFIAQVDFIAQDFMFENLQRYSKIYAVLTQKYDPLQNYNGDEKREIERTPNLLETTTNGERETNTRNEATVDKTEFLQGTHTSTLQNTTNNDTSFRNKEKTEDTQTGKDVTDINTGARVGKVTNASSIDKVAQTGHENTVETYHREGNLGVTSSQDMLNQEIEVRMFDFIKMIVEDFVTSQCYPYPMYRGKSENELTYEFMLN